eukprot:NODE_4_length_77007_cov_1.156642.p17 type:complete len:437 gc:universal NODE_4_length_77007_cov_1.156642:5720-7030(+)
MTEQSISSGSSNEPKLRPFIRKVIQLQRLGKDISPINTDFDLPEEIFGNPGVDVTTHDPILEAIHTSCEITIFDYDKESILLTHCDNDNISSFLKNHPKDPASCRWLHVDGISYDIIKLLGVQYDLHPLALEDIIHINQRIKVDKYPDSLFVSLLALSNISNLHGSKSVRPPSTTSSLPLLRSDKFEEGVSIDINDIVDGSYNDADVQQLSLFLLPNNVVISFMTGKSLLFFQDIHNRLHAKNTLLRQSADSSLLVHAIIDCIVDHALPIIKHYGRQISFLESSVFKKPQVIFTKALHRIQVELNILRNTLLPFLNVISSMKSDSQMVTPLTKTYLNDVQDHINTITENIDFLSVWSKNLIDLSFNMLSYEMNVILKILAIVSCLFLPITFLAGVYGTNFEQLPEYKWEFGYVYFWGLQITVVVMMISFFKFKNWI